jgi:hypothetical protein
MIEKIKLMYHLTENAYEKICGKTGLDIKKSKGNFISFENQKISRIDLYTILYKTFGRIWFMEVSAEFPKFNCKYDEFEYMLYNAYGKLFGNDIALLLPKYDEGCCSYIEFSQLVEVESAQESISLLHMSMKFKREQLDSRRWDEFKKPHGTIEFLMNEESNTCIRLFARCRGSALKNRIKDTSVHRPAGVIPSAVVNVNTEKEIMSWLCSVNGLYHEGIFYNAPTF